MGRIYRDIIIADRIVIYDPDTEKDYLLDSGALVGFLQTPEETVGSVFYRDIIRTQNLIIGNNEYGRALDLGALISGAYAAEYTLPDPGAVFYRDTVIAASLRIGNRAVHDEMSMEDLRGGGLTNLFGEASSETGIIDASEGAVITEIGEDSLTVVSLTTVGTLLDSVESADGSLQTYAVTDSVHTPKTTGALVTGDILVVTAEDEIATKSYTITVAA